MKGVASAGNETSADLAFISFPGLHNMSGAEGEEPQPHVKEEDNPFSFKTFLKRSSDGVGDGKPPKREGQKRKGRTTSRTDETLPFPETGGIPDENPFSFKKFVKRKEKHQPLRTQKEDNQLVSSSSDSDDTESLPFPLNAPMTKQHHLPGLKKKTSKTESQPNLFTDSELSSESLIESPTLLLNNQQMSSSDITSATLGTFVGSDPLGLVTNTTTAEGVEVEDIGRDFDSSLEVIDGEQHELLPSVPGAGVEVLVAAGPGSGHLMKEIKKLRSENERMKSELQKSQEETKLEKERNKTLREQLKALKKKDTEDTKALEDMVQKVEENLVTTTKRAISAEAIIGKLKLEIQNLQAQISLANPETVQQKYEEILVGVRDKATFASQQLTVAAQKADHSIRELLSGVDTLKNVAEILEYIDRISEMKQK